MSFSSGFNLKNLRPHPRGEAHSFEDFCCYIFKKLSGAPDGSKYQRIHGLGGDGGVEAIYRLPSGDVWGIQAKFVENFSKALGEFEKSLKVAISVRENLSKYIVCAPLPLTGMKNKGDEKVDGMWEKSEKWIEKLNNTILSDKNTEIEMWGEDELETKFIELDAIAKGGQFLYWFNKHNFTDDWFSRKLNKAKLQAGDRYSPELHVDTSLLEKFQFFGQTSSWKERITNLSQDFAEKLFLLEKYSKVEGAIETNLRQNLLFVNNKANFICKDLNDSLVDPKKLTDSNFFSEVNKLENILVKLNKTIIDMQEKEYGADIDSEKFSQLFSNPQSAYLIQTRIQIKNVLKILDEISQLSSEKFFNLAATNVMLIEGEAGVGKTHGIVNLAIQRSTQKLRSLVFFGEDFYYLDPWVSMIDYLGSSMSSEKLLEALNVAGEASGFPLIIIIDALNESKDQTKWQSWLPQLIADVSNYRNLKLCISCRDIPVPQVIPNSLPICVIKHNGFAGNEINAQITYWNHYCPNVPKKFYFHKEFSNPLFLKIFFESLQAITENLETNDLKYYLSYKSFYSIIENWIESKNRKIAKELDYDDRNNLVNKVLAKLAEIMIDQKSRTIPLNDVYKVIEEVTSLDSDKFFRMIENESLVSGIEQLDLNSSEQKNYVVRFAYERIGDRLIAEKLISSNNNLNVLLKPGHSLHNYLADEDSIYEYSGIIEALSILLPEKTGNELIDFVDFKNNPVIIEQFISSINWRDKNYVTERTIDLMLNLLKNFKYEIKGFECLLENSTKEGHPFNAEFLHNYLIDQKMVDRDGFWGNVIGESYSGWSSAVNKASPVYNLTDTEIILKSKLISEHVLLLWAQTLCWFLSSTDQRIRDRATKAITVILLENSNFAIKLLQKFQNCNDEYIIERLLVAIYGALLLNKSIENATKVSKYLFEKYCNSEQWPLNVSIRDHILLIIELALSLNSKKISFDKSKIQTLISKVEPVINSSTDRDRPEVEDWWVKIIDFGTNSGINFFPYFEQYEILPRIRGLVDNEQLEGNFDYKSLNNGFLNAVIRLGYPGNDDRCANFDLSLMKKFGSYSTGIGMIERLGKKYNWIILMKLMGQIIDQKRSGIINTPLDSETEFEIMKLRDIDPTDIRSNMQKINGKSESYSYMTYEDQNNELNFEDWCITNDFGDISEFVQIEDSQGNRFYTLNMETDWHESEKLENDKPYRSVSMNFCGIFVDSSDLKKVITKFSDGNTRQTFELYDEPTDYLGYIGEWPNFGPFSKKLENPMSLDKDNFSPKFSYSSGKINRDTDWEHDDSSTNIPRVFYTPSPKLLKFGELKWNFVSDWENSDGESVIVTPKWGAEDEVTGIIVSASFINQYLKENDETFVLFCYQSKMILNSRDHFKGLFVETLLFLEDDKFEIVEPIVRYQ